MLICAYSAKAGSISAVITEATGPNFNNGSIDLVIDGGFEPFEFIWTGPNGFSSSSEDISGLIPGDYCVTVTDALCGIAEECFVVCPDRVELVLTGQVNNDCPDDRNGSLTFDVLGVLLDPYTVQIDEGEYMYNAMNAELIWSELPIGTHCITILDHCANTFTDCYEIQSNGSDILLDESISHLCGDNNGSISVLPSGGLEPYEFLWSTGEIGNSISGLSLGAYCVTVTDRCNQSMTECYQLESLETSIQIEELTHPSLCTDEGQGGSSDSNDGAITVVVLPPDGYDLISLSWIGPNGFASSSTNLTNLSPGTYVVTASFGLVGSNTITCSITEEIDLSCCVLTIQEETPSGDYTSVPYIYQTNVEEVNIISPPDESCTGSIEISVLSRLFTSHGLGQSSSYFEGSYTYSWTGPDGFNSNEEDISDLCLGTYCLTIYDGCTETNECYEIVNCSLIEIAIAASVIETCPGYAEGQISVIASGGEAPYKFLWNDGSTNKSRTNLGVGTYSVTVFDSQGCSEAMSISMGNSNGLTNVETTNPCGVSTYCGATVVNFTGGTLAWRWSTEDCRVREQICSTTGAAAQSITFPYNSTFFLGCQKYGICPDAITQQLITVGINTTRYEWIQKCASCRVLQGCLVDGIFEATTVNFGSVTFGPTIGTGGPCPQAWGIRQAYCSGKYMGNCCWPPLPLPINEVDQIQDTSQGFLESDQSKTKCWVSVNPMSGNTVTVNYVSSFTERAVMRIHSVGGVLIFENEIALIEGHFSVLRRMQWIAYLCGMDDKEIFASGLGISNPWYIDRIE